MKIVSTVATPIVALGMFLAIAATPAQEGDTSTMCDIGPVQKNYGGTDWVVYSCPDQRTVIIYSAANNPGKEFYFMFYRKDGKLKLYGEGNGDKKYTDLAFKELALLTQKDVDALIQEARAATSRFAAPANPDVWAHEK